MPLFGLFWLLKKVAANKSSLRQVYLVDKYIGDDGAKRLAKALRGNTVVTELSLWGNSIGDVGATVLADMLKHNSSIADLNLGGNRIGDVGARALAEALEINSSVTVLHLGGNSIGNVGATALAKALRHNSSVTTLRLESNSIGDDGARELVEMLHVNSFITDLILVNWTITNLSLRSNNISDKLDQRVDELTKINNDALNPEEAHRLKIVCKVGWLLDSEIDAETAAAVDLALDSLGSFLMSGQRQVLFRKLLNSTERGAEVAASVDVAMARTLYRYAADCGAAPVMLMNLLRAHPPLCACRDERHGLFPFMLLATMEEAGVGDVLELLLLNPNLVESGIGEPVVQLD